ncbi:hypothetical protein [Lysobacter capsici]|uniref:hypothetical protein n=1 Tax=Lysobacter capsici TaxID=435897 RepID=UPI00128FE016|nr:hypothetical protein [Lysobacter capsici]
MKISQRQPRILRARAMGGASLHRTNESRRLAADPIQQSLATASCRVFDDTAADSCAARRHRHGHCWPDDDVQCIDIPTIGRHRRQYAVEPKPMRFHTHDEATSC